MSEMTIGKVARKAGVGVETIRFYERRGLIEQPPKPESSGFRVYPAEVMQRIRFIRQAQELGFSLKEIAELQSLRADASTDSGRVREHARAKLEDVDRKMARLKRIRLALKDLIAACPGEGAPLRACSIMDALEGGEKAEKRPKQRKETKR